MSFCYIPRPPSPTAFPLSALRLSAFPLRVFPAAPPPLQSTRARVLFFLAFPPSSLAQANPPFFCSPPACLPGCRALRCRPFVTLFVLLNYVFFSHASFLFLILLSFSPVFLFLPRRFAIFLCFCIFSRAILHPRHPPLALSLSLSRSPFHSCSLFFGRIGLFFPFPVTALPQFSSASLFYPLDVVFPVLLYSFLRLMITGIALLTAFPFRGIASLRSRFN